MSDIPEWAQQKIQEAREKRLTELNLSCGPFVPYNTRLTHIPDEIFSLEWLQVLNLHGNQLTEIPDVIALLHSLQGLYLSNNQLASLPETIAQLHNLKWLDLSSNRFTYIPEVITQLHNLQGLYLNYNRLAIIPQLITQLQNLQWLDLSNNQFTMLPEGMDQLTSLQELDVGDNQLVVLPEEITQLSELRVLDLRNNRFTALAEGITQLPRLQSLYLDGNPIETPPPEILSLDQSGKADIEKIRGYFRQLTDEQIDHLYEAKLIIVGEGGAGKTTLAKKILNPAYELCDEDTTRGIEVMRWEFPLPEEKTGDSPKSLVFRVNIWDFGGQEIYHATHQFFLTKRSLYALVADSRKEDTDFYYWLNISDLLSDGSPLLLIKNEKQDRRREINDRQLRGQFDNLKESLAVNLATNRGLAEILDCIRHYITHLPHVGTALPKTWVRVRQALEQDPRNYIGLPEYLGICERNGFTRLDDKLQLAGYLHDLGVCLHFQDDVLLKKTVILKPHWGTAAVYKVLDNERVIQNQGRFTRANLADIWRDEQYAGMHDELAALMLKFKLCYELPGSPGVFIAPQLLSPNQPEYKWDETDNLYMRCTYEFMPKGIITHLIVELHRLIADQCYVWRSGVVLEKDHTRAEILEHYGKREMQIRVAGKHKKELLTVVAYELGKIHDSYNRLKYSKWIPCNCAKCETAAEPHFYPFDTLRQFVADRQEHIQCQKSYQMVNVLGLIDDLDISWRNQVSPRNLVSGLRRLLIKHFDIDELRTLCFELGIDYDSLRGESRDDKARELVTYLERRGRLDELVEVGRRLRPDIDWDEAID